MALFAVLAALAACGPQYVQDYDLFPPASAQGKQCVTECTVTKESCEKSCYRDALYDCRYDSGMGVGFGYGHRGYWDTQFGSAFPSDYQCRSPNACLQTCRAQQLACHKNCGGTVVPREPRCVGNCPTTP
jgi:hypothetical protein